MKVWVLRDGIKKYFVKESGAYIHTSDKEEKAKFFFNFEDAKRKAKRLGIGPSGTSYDVIEIQV